MTNRNSPFGISARELRELMECRKTEGVTKIAELGGMQGLCDKLKTSPTNGLDGSKSDLENRRRVFGSNVLPSKLAKSFLSLVWEALQDITLIILEICAVISFGLSFYSPDSERHDIGVVLTEHDQYQNFIESIAIFVCVIVVVLIAACNDYSKERQFRLLEKRIQSEHKVALIRNGELFHTFLSDVVVGDIAHVKYGESLPADGCLLLGNELMVDESSLTGESEHVAKDVDTDPMMLSGTNVMEGSGKMVVTAVGVNSQAGIMMTLLGFAEDSEKHVEDRRKSEEAAEAKKNRLTRRRLTNYATPSDELLETRLNVPKAAPADMDDPDFSGKRTSVLQAKLTRLAIQIGYVGAFMSALTVIILITGFCIKAFVIQQKPWKNSYIRTFVKYFIIGITLLVAVVPEGLPLAVTLSLAYSVKKMMNDNNLVRHLYACETMGNATTICCDKTGTLTTNRMTVVDAYVWDNRYERKSFPELKEKAGIPPVLIEMIAEGISLNSSYTSTILQGTGLPVQIGNKTECALLGFVQELGANYQSKRDEMPESEFTFVYTYNSKRKCMGTVIPLRNSGGFRLHVKGASEVMLKRCSFILGRNGALRKVTTEEYDRLIIEVIEGMAREGLRTIALCYRDFVGGPLNWEDEGKIINHLVCFCIVGIEDPLRPEVPEAIRICQRAGITVRMITGDNINTARAIAFKCGIFKAGERFLILDSQQFNRKIRDSHGVVQQNLLDKVWPRLRVLARSSPSDKFTLVKGIIDSKIGKYHEVVAVTGDGTNDGPALKKADVGFAMGISGTDVAKEASDIILTDDNFTSIVKAVMWGRNVYDSIAKFLQFQMTVSVVAVTVAFTGACAVQDTPLKAVQMLWVNCIMDTFASLALATENPTAELLLRKPYGRTKPLISITMLKNIIGQAIYQLTIIFFLLFHGDWLLDVKSGRRRDLLFRSENVDTPTEHFTIIFNTFILMTLLNEINARKLYGQRNVFKGIFKSPIFYTVWVLTMLAQLVIVQYGGLAFSTEALTFQQWLWCIFFGVGVLLWAQLIVSVPVEKLYRKFRRESLDDHNLKSSESAIRARRLWNRTVRRLRIELKVIRNFQSGLLERQQYESTGEVGKRHVTDFT